MSRNIRRPFTDDFKQPIVDLYESGKKRSELIKEYDLTPSTFDKWVKQARTTANKDTYSISDICHLLDMSRSSYYYKSVEPESESELEESIQTIFLENKARSGKNEAPVPNHLDRQFDKHQPLEALITDLTYVRVKQRWAYVCFIIDLYNREIIGLPVG